ncbi:metallophosphoesterase [Candidatus Peregrinibacteria bacterium]|nr:metallophosphoesterase [Candidatus Peregrinibacteria bacterium]
MHFVTDAIIIAFLVADGILVIDFIRNGLTGPMGKFSWGLVLFFLAALTCWILVFYGSFIEPRFITIKRETVQLNENPAQTMRAVLISDTHFGPYKQTGFAQKIAERVSTLNPDVIFLLGDFIYDDESDVQYLSPFKNLKASLGVFAILGNHDYGNGRGYKDCGAKGEARAKKVHETLEGLGIKVLVNAGQKITFEGKDIFILGVDDLWTKRADIASAIQTFGQAKTPRPSILIAHNPDSVKTAEKLGIDLVLSGHTHGGQIRLPFWGPVPPLPDTLGRKYDKGLFRFDKTQLYITSGVGEIGARARLFDPPEIVLMKIKF